MENNPFIVNMISPSPKANPSALKPSERNVTVATRTQPLDSKKTNASDAAKASDRAVQGILCHPDVIAFVPYDDLRQLPQVSRTMRSNLNDACYWQTMCSAFAAKYDLYCPRRLACDPRSYLSEELFTCRQKWNEDHVQQQIFKIRVSSRFKPGDQSSSRFALPLHQFLKVRSAQKKRGDAVEVFVGERPPDRFLDALLGSVMSKPVMLPDSRKVLDRTVAMACVARGGKDPFTGSRLTASMLVPQVELAAEIAEFQQRAKNVDIGIDAQDAMELVEGVDPVMLEAMVAVEQLKFAARRAYNDALDPNAAHRQPQSDDDRTLAGAPPPIAGAIDNSAQGSQPSHAMHPNASKAAKDLPAAFDDSIDPDDPSHGYSDDGTSAFVPRWLGVKAESARLVDICKARATVTMNVPGTGIRPFYFNAVFPQQDDQPQLYQQCAQKIVTSALNGSNGCIICYGQTGSGMILFCMIIMLISGFAYLR
jgi:hypothetical protein